MNKTKIGIIIFLLVAMVCYTLYSFFSYNTQDFKNEIVSINQTLPKFLNENERLDSIKVINDKTLNYYVTIIGATDEHIYNVIKEQYNDNFIKNLQTDKGMHKLKNLGITFNCYFFDSSKKLFYETEITPEMYN